MTLQCYLCWVIPCIHFRMHALSSLSSGWCFLTIQGPQCSLLTLHKNLTWWLANHFKEKQFEQANGGEFIKTAGLCVTAPLEKVILITFKETKKVVLLVTNVLPVMLKPADWSPACSPVSRLTLLLSARWALAATRTLSFSFFLCVCVKILGISWSSSSSSAAAAAACFQLAGCENFHERLVSSSSESN